MMGLYRYVGTYARIFETKFEFTKFGQLVEIDDKLASTVCHLIPAAQFDTLGFTSAELTKWSDISRHRLAPPDFIAKRQAAWAMAQKQTRPADSQTPVPEAKSTSIEQTGVTHVSS